VVTGKPPELGGSVARREATGRGLVSLLPTATTHLGFQVEGSRIVVHGFGNVGQYAALAAHEMGALVVAVSDVTGGIYNPDGLDIPRVQEWVAENGTLAGFPDVDSVTNQEIFELDCDILIPAAIGGVITGDNADKIKARMIAEGANGPTTLDADNILRERNIFTIPDILANAGGVTVSYFEWVQDLQNYFWSEGEIVARLREIMGRAFEEVLNIAINEDYDMRTAALVKGIRRVAQAKLVRGVYP
jgi:glutamate dehydrogenase (NAD(P)+)